MTHALQSDDRLFRLAAAGDAVARDHLVERYMPLAIRMARKLFHTSAERDDLIQVASFALVKAIDRYDPGRGTTFVTFAMPTISGELKRFIRDTGWALRVPRSLQERSLELDAAIAQLEPDLGRSPTIAELAKHLGATREEVIEACEVAACRNADSLDEPAGDDSAEPVERLGDEDAGYELVEDRATIAPLLRELRPREREILRLRFGAELTQREIADQLGISQMHVSRLIRRSLDGMAAAA